MGRELAAAFPAAREVFAEVDEALGFKLTDVMWQGPKETLTLTENTQPALVAVSVAVARVLEKEKGIRLAERARFFAGHSVGEYSALAAAGALSLADAVRLTRLRGQSMQKAVPVGEGAMVALLGVGLDVARAVAAEAAQFGVCDVANDNEPTQVVLSGHKVALDHVAEIGKKHGVRRAVPLPVSAPFHSRLMQPAADVMAEALAKVAIKAPSLPIYANVQAAPVTDPEQLRKGLVEQVVGSVRWRESVAAMGAAGVTRFYELGSGKVLAGLAKRIIKDAEAMSVGTPADIDALLTDLAR